MSYVRAHNFTFIDVQDRSKWRRFGQSFAGINARILMMIMAVNLSVLTTGMSFAWPSPMLVKLRNFTETPLTRPMTVGEGSWMVSLGFLFGVLSDIIGGMLMDAIGRKKCLILTSIPKLLMPVFLLYANEPWMIILARTVMITNDCLVFMVVPIYTSELAQLKSPFNYFNTFFFLYYFKKNLRFFYKEHRGALGSFLQLFSSIGALITLGVGPFTSYRNFNSIFVTLIAITSLPFFWLPDSPYFLYKKGQKEKAVKILSKIRESESYITEEIKDYRNACKKLHKSASKLKLFKNKAFAKSLALGVVMCIGAQLTGYNAVAAYLQTILKSTQTNIRPEIASVIIGVLEVFIGISSIFITNIFGRRTILMWSLTGMFIGMVGMAAFFQLTEVGHHEITGFLNYLPLISIALIICCYCSGLGCLFWPIIAELFDNHTRAFGVSTCLIPSATFIFIMTKFFSSMDATLGSAGTFWFFSGMTVVLIVLLGLFLPETKNKTFNEIQMALGETTANAEVQNEDR